MRSEGKSQRSRFTCNYVLLTYGRFICHNQQSWHSTLVVKQDLPFMPSIYSQTRPPRGQQRRCSSWQMKLFLFMQLAEECSVQFPSDGGASKKRQPFSLSIRFQLLQQTFGTIIFTTFSIEIIFSLMVYLFGQLLIEF